MLLRLSAYVGWNAVGVDEVAALLLGISGAWWLSGGWGIDEFVAAGPASREHGASLSRAALTREMVVGANMVHRAGGPAAARSPRSADEHDWLLTLPKLPSDEQACRSD